MKTGEYRLGKSGETEKRTIGRARGTKRKVSREREQVDTMSNSRDSGGIIGPSCHLDATPNNTKLPPTYQSPEGGSTAEGGYPGRRHSAGCIGNPSPVDMLPFELVKKPIRLLMYRWCLSSWTSQL